MSERPLPSGLRDALKERRIVPFVGAGVSKGIRHNGSGRPIFPDWMELLKRAADLLDSQGQMRTGNLVRALLEADPPDFLDAAERAQNALKPADWSKFLYGQFAVDRASVAEETLSQARQLWRIGSPVVITTNYDSVLKWASPGSQALTWHIENKFGLARFIDGTHNQPTVWHLHGEIDRPDELILSPDGYTRLYNSEMPNQTSEKYIAALTALRTVLATRRLLFIGFSFGDRALSKQLEWLRETFSGQSGPHYALVHRDRFNEVVRALRDVDVECVCYPDHGTGLLALLTEMCELASGDGPAAARPSILSTAQLNFPSTQKAVTAQDWFPGCARMSVDSGGQGNTAESFDVLLDLRFGRGQVKSTGITLQYSISEAELLYDLAHCTWDGPLLGDSQQHPCLIPEPLKWRIVGPQDSEGTLAGSSILNEVLGRVRASSEQHLPEITMTLSCHRSHFRYTILDGTTDDPIEISANKAAAIAAFLTKFQLDEGGWTPLSEAHLVWGRKP